LVLLLVIRLLDISVCFDSSNEPANDFSTFSARHAIINTALGFDLLIREIKVTFKLDFSNIDACRETPMNSEDFLLGHFYEVLAGVERLFGYEEPSRVFRNGLLSNFHEHNFDSIFRV
jgi:hypothetical protein